MNSLPSEPPGEPRGIGRLHLWKKIKWNQDGALDFYFRFTEQSRRKIKTISSVFTFWSPLSPSTKILGQTGALCSSSSSVIFCFGETYAFMIKLWNDRWKKLSKYFQDKPGDLSLNQQWTKRERERDRERQFPIQTCCLRANGSIIMIDSPESLSSGTLNGVGTDQCLHWRWSHILLHLGSNITECEIHSSHGHCLPFQPNLGVWKSCKIPQPISIYNALKLQSSAI